MNSFLQPATIHIHEHQISSPDDWPEEVEVLVDLLKLRADDIPAFSSTESAEKHSGGVDTPDLDSSLIDELKAAASEVSFNLDLLEEIQGELCGAHGMTWPYICKVLAKLWPNEQPNCGATIVVPIDPCHFDNPTARFQPPYMHADALLTTRLELPVSEPDAPEAPAGVSGSGTPPDEARSPHDDQGSVDTASKLEHPRSAGTDEHSTDGAGALGSPGEGDRQSGKQAQVTAGSHQSPIQESVDKSTEEQLSDPPSRVGSSREDEHGTDAYTAQQAGEIVDNGIEQEYSEADYPDEKDHEDESHPKDDDVDTASEEVDKRSVPSLFENEDADYYDDDYWARRIRHLQVLALAGEFEVDLVLLCASFPTKLYYTMASSLLQRYSLGFIDPMVGIVCVRGVPHIRLALGWITTLTDRHCVEVHIACGAASAQPSRELGIFDVRNPAGAFEFSYCLAMLRDHTRDITRWVQDHFLATLHIPPLHWFRWRLDLAGREHSDPKPPSLGDSLGDRIEKWRAAVAYRSGSSARASEADSSRSIKGSSVASYSRSATDTTQSVA